MWVKISRTAICNNHDEIIGLARNIYRYASAACNSDDLDEMHGIADKILGWSNDIELETICAKDAGQAMENRLQEYYYAIEGLGFTRHKH
jgi:hypothetical protein